MLEHAAIDCLSVLKQSVDLSLLAEVVVIGCELVIVVVEVWLLVVALCEGLGMEVATVSTNVVDTFPPWPDPVGNESEYAPEAMGIRDAVSVVVSE